MTSLAGRHPHVAESWHPTKNGALAPDDVTASSERRVWWFCAKAADHVWRCSVQYRTKRGCPFCAGKRLCRSNSLAHFSSRLAREWHPTKNEPLTPHGIVHGSERRVWWRCHEGHEWEAILANRSIGGRNCPSCAGQRVSATNNLAARAPGALRFWHPAKNLPLTPWNVVAGSSRKVWWRCSKGPDHEWTAPLHFQTLRDGRCPFCSRSKLSVTNCLATCNPHVASEWHPTKNGTLTPRDILSAVSRKIWWLCSLGHEWQALVANRTTKGTGCPVCGRVRAARSRRDRNRLRQKVGWR